MKQTLSNSEKATLSIISEISNLNPFGEKRKQLETTLLKDASKNDSLEKRIQLNRFCLKALTTYYRNGPTKYSNFKNNDKEIIKNCSLFYVYLQHITTLDQHIEKELASKKTIPFEASKSILRLLNNFGFSSKESTHYFALFYQIRRAYYFIEDTLFGQCESINTLRFQLWNALFTWNIKFYDDYCHSNLSTFSLLFLGDTGTGKGTAAKALGYSSYIPFDLKTNKFKYCFSNLFLQTNLSQYPESLIESELFGHKKGSFTDSIDNYEGLFSQLNEHSTLFLDEIGDLTLEVQVKLLNVLQDRKYCPVGSKETKELKGRVLTATNQDLETQIKNNLFREDLFYRISSDTITLPTLAKRISQNNKELALLSENIITKIFKKPIPELASFVINILKDQIPKHYSWCGNVRELEQCIKQIIMTQSVSLSRAESNPPDIEQKDAKSLLSTHAKKLYEKYKSYQLVAKELNIDWRTAKNLLR
ncbi:hypothetical protein DID80_00400 [Candidatus Marinamargulisbacteria bacterium SCGC AAA071-K20]|nr:hypothetical protein DID80_00400 [Candidatus Marinamargulisbacteria bacterium SCGC AAA071-K20]